MILIENFCRDWKHARTIFINELIKSGEFTEKQLEEVQM